LVARRQVTLCKIVTIAAVVEPEGLKANWSEKVKPGGGVRSAG